MTGTIVTWLSVRAIFHAHASPQRRSDRFAHRQNPAPDPACGGARALCADAVLSHRTSRLDPDAVAKAHGRYDLATMDGSGRDVAFTAAIGGGIGGRSFLQTPRHRPRRAA